MGHSFFDVGSGKPMVEASLAFGLSKLHEVLVGAPRPGSWLGGGPSESL